MILLISLIYVGNSRYQTGVELKGPTRSISGNDEARDLEDKQGRREGCGGHLRAAGKKEQAAGSSGRVAVDINQPASIRRSKEAASPLSIDKRLINMKLCSI